MLDSNGEGYQHPLVFINKGTYFLSALSFFMLTPPSYESGLNPFVQRGNLTLTSLFLFVSHPFTAPPPLYMAHDLSILILQDHSIIFCLEDAARRFSSRVWSVVTPHSTSHQNFSTQPRNHLHPNPLGSL